MRDLIIVCEDSFGLDVRMIVEHINDYYVKMGWGLPYHLKGYLCPKGTVLKQNPDSLPIIGSLEDWKPGDEERYAMGIVNPEHKMAAVQALKSKGAIFETLWAPWVLTPLTMHFGEGCIIAAQSIKINAKIGNFVTLYESMVADATIGDYCSIMAYSNTTNSIIGELTYIANNAATMLNVPIGDHCQIMNNSIVVKKLKPNTKVFGIPAKKYKE